MKTIMDSNTQVFFDFTTTRGTLLRSPPGINLSKELSTFPAHILDEGSKLPKRGIKHMLPKYPFGTGAVVQVFHEDHIASVTKSMGLLKVKILPGVVNLMVKSCNFEALFLVIFRAFLLSRKPALQQFQLALQILKKLGRFYEYTITGCQKLLQPNIHANGMTMWHRVRDADITLNADRCIPSVSFPHDSYLLDYEPVRDRSMQIYWNYSNLGQLNVVVCYRILLELGKQQRFKLPVLLESGKAKAPILKVFPTTMQLLN